MFYGFLAFLIFGVSIALTVIPYFAENRKTPLVVSLAWLVVFCVGMLGIIITQIIFNVSITAGGHTSEHIAWARDALSVYFTPFFFFAVISSLIFTLAAFMNHKLAIMRSVGGACVSIFILILTPIYASLTSSEGVNVSAYIYSFGLFFSMLPAARGVIDNFRLWREFEAVVSDREIRRRKAKERREYHKKRKFRS